MRQDVTRLRNIASTPGGKATIAFVCCLLGLYAVGLVYTIRVRAPPRQHFWCGRTLREPDASSRLCLLNV